MLLNVEVDRAGESSRVAKGPAVRGLSSGVGVEVVGGVRIDCVWLLDENMAPWASSVSSNDLLKGLSREDILERISMALDGVDRLPGE